MEYSAKAASSVAFERIPIGSNRDGGSITSCRLAERNFAPVLTIARQRGATYAGLERLDRKRPGFIHSPEEDEQRRRHVRGHFAERLHDIIGYQQANPPRPGSQGAASNVGELVLFTDTFRVCPMIVELALGPMGVNNFGLYDVLSTVASA